MEPAVRCAGDLNQAESIGTLTETIQAALMAKNAGWNTVMSQRSGETEDVTIHLAVGLGTVTRLLDVTFVSELLA